MAKSLCVVVLTVLMGSSLPAQDGSVFTGRWILESPSQPPPDMPRELSVRTISRDLTIERQFESGARSETHQIGVVGGTVPGLGPDGKTDGPRRYHSVKWDSNALVFESGSYTAQFSKAGAWTWRREAWSLDSDGRLHVVIATRSAVDAPRTVALVYRRP